MWTAFLTVCCLLAFAAAEPYNYNERSNQDEFGKIIDGAKKAIHTAKDACGALMCTDSTPFTHSECCGIPPSIECCQKIREEVWMGVGLIVALIALCACCKCLCRCCCRKQPNPTPTIVINTIRSAVTQDPPYQIMNDRQVMIDPEA